MVAFMEVDMVVDMEVDKVAAMAADEGGHSGGMEVDIVAYIVADMVADMEVDKVAKCTTNARDTRILKKIHNFNKISQF